MRQMCRVTSDNTQQKDGGTLNSEDSNCDAAGHLRVAPLLSLKAHPQQRPWML